MARSERGTGTGRQATTKRSARPPAKAPARAAKRRAAPRTPPAPKRGAGGRRASRRARPETLRLRAFSPGLTVDDLARSIDFYSRALGFVVAARVRACGGKITEEPVEKSWGARVFSVDDPDGFHLTFFRAPAAR